MEDPHKRRLPAISPLLRGPHAVVGATRLVLRKLVVRAKLGVGVGGGLGAPHQLRAVAIRGLRTRAGRGEERGGVGGYYDDRTRPGLPPSRQLGWAVGVAGWRKPRRAAQAGCGQTLSTVSGRQRSSWMRRAPPRESFFFDPPDPAQTALIASQSAANSAQRGGEAWGGRMWRCPLRAATRGTPCSQLFRCWRPGPPPEPSDLPPGTASGRPQSWP